MKHSQNRNMPGKKPRIVMRVFLFSGNKMYNVQWLVQILEKIQGVT